MPAYLIAEHTITDPKKFEEYRVKVGPTIAKHGGRYIRLLRGGAGLSFFGMSRRVRQKSRGQVFG